MTKQKIIDHLVKKSGIQRNVVHYIVDAFLQQIIESCKKGEKVEIRGFGTFSKTSRKGRKVFSPIAGRKLSLPPKTVITFKASKMTEETLDSN
ncbi:MAG: integration host factor subunit beta [Spirochaetes bacterium]|nr:integration host factor subunit beta [Spirochaetota bacterium]